MWQRFKRWLGYKFGGTSQPTPPVVTEPSEPTPINNVPVQPPIIVTPTTGGRVLDKVNNGTPRNPDHKFLYDNLVIDHDKLSTVAWYCNQFDTNKARYTKVTNVTGVPEWFIFLLHIRECSLDFNKVLHNGQTLSHVNSYGTTWVPKGRGKGKHWTWEDAAFDALVLKKYHNKSSWALVDTLEDLEKWNGLGYRSRVGDKGVVEYSPFIVAGSAYHDETSKYVSDGKYDKYAKEKQLGVYVILKGLEERGSVVLY